MLFVPQEAVPSCLYNDWEAASMKKESLVVACPQEAAQISFNICPLVEASVIFVVVDNM